MSCSSSPSPSLPFPPPPSAPQLLLSFYPPLPVPTPHSPFLPNTRSPPAPPATSSASQQTAPTTPRTAATVESLSSKAQASASATEDGRPSSPRAQSSLPIACIARSSGCIRRRAIRWDSRRRCLHLMGLMGRWHMMGGVQILPVSASGSGSPGPRSDADRPIAEPSLIILLPPLNRQAAPRLCRSSHHHRRSHCSRRHHAHQEGTRRREVPRAVSRALPLPVV